MRTALRVTVATAALLGSFAPIGAGTASATPPVAVPQPGGVIRMDIAPGEWWYCEGDSLQLPWLQRAQGQGQVYVGAAGFTLGANHSYLRYAPGTDVLISCVGTGLPVEYFGPVIKTVP
jgi:hypothetical protein